MKKMTLMDARAAAFGESMKIIDDMRCNEAGLFTPKHSGQRGADRSEALYDAYRAIKERAGRAFSFDGAVPVGDWPKKTDERVLLYVVHPNAALEKNVARRQAEWEGWFSGHWTDFNKGGWVWHGMIGEVTHIAPLPNRPDLAP